MTLWKRNYKLRFALLLDREIQSNSALEKTLNILFRFFFAAVDTTIVRPDVAGWLQAREQQGADKIL